jgi:hypothetical protein
MISMLNQLRITGFRDATDPQVSIPPLLQNLLARKIEQLDTADRTLLTTASVLGRNFDSASLAELLSVTLDEVEERLHPVLRMHEFIRHIGPAELPGRGLSQCYQFVHTLDVIALQRSLPPSRLSTLKSKVARTATANFF